MMDKVNHALRGALISEALIVGFVFVTVALMRTAGLLQGLELGAYDLLLRARALEPPSEQHIVVVGVDDEDIDRLGWPLPDEVLAMLLRRLLAYQPAVIGVDIYRDQPIGRGGPELADLLAADDRIYWVSKFAAADSPAVAPPAALIGTERVGFSDIVPDGGGTVRRGILFLDDGHTVDFSLSLRLALRYLADHDIFPAPGDDDPRHLKLGPTTIAPFEANDGSYRAADARGYQYMLDYRWGQPAFPLYGLDEVLDGRLAAESIAGKIVLIGVRAASVKDYFYTPFSRDSRADQASFGVMLHGEMASQLLRHAIDGTPPTRSLSEPMELLWILVWTLVGAGLSWLGRSPLLFAAAVIGALAGLGALCMAAILLFWWLPLVPAGLGTLGAAGLGASYMVHRERRDRARLMGLFSRHVSGAVADEIWQRRDEFLEQGRPKPRVLSATVLFADIEGFTEVSERLAAPLLIDWLNAYLAAMAEVVTARGGVIDKYIGDAVMAVFGAPLPVRSEDKITEQARTAVSCALDMGRALGPLNRRLQDQGLPAIRVRIGIHSGDLVAGSLGGAERLEYTVIGDTVNTAARLESYASRVAQTDASGRPCTIVISQATRDRLGEGFITQSLGEAMLKGKSEPLSIYLVIDDAGAEIPATKGDL